MHAIRSAPFRRPMARLAVLAILLLALVPTLGRLAEARAAAGATPAWAALCTVRGLERVALPSAAPGASRLATPAGRGPAGDAPGAPHGTASGDCDYCPLLATVLPAAVAPVQVPPATPQPALCTSRPSPSRDAPHPCGLGSRGPPSAS